MVFDSVTFDIVVAVDDEGRKADDDDGGKADGDDGDKAVDDEICDDDKEATDEEETGAAACVEYVWAAADDEELAAVDDDEVLYVPGEEDVNVFDGHLGFRWGQQRLASAWLSIMAKKIKSE